MTENLNSITSISNADNAQTGTMVQVKNGQTWVKCGKRWYSTVDGQTKSYPPAGKIVYAPPPKTFNVGDFVSANEARGLPDNSVVAVVPDGNARIICAGKGWYASQGEMKFLNLIGDYQILHIAE